MTYDQQGGAEPPVDHSTTELRMVANLFEDTVTFLGGNRAVAALASATGTTTDAVRVGVVLSLPVVITGLAQWSDDAAGHYWLQSRLDDFQRPVLDDYATLAADTPLLETAGGLQQVVFGEREERVRARIAARAGLSDLVAGRILVLAMATVLTHLSRVNQEIPEEGFAIRHLGHQRRRLANDGWEVWLAELTSEDDPHALDTATAAAPPEPDRFDAPGRGGQAAALSGAGLLGYDPDDALQVEPPEPGTETRDLVQRYGESGGERPSSPGLILLLAGLAVVVVLALVALIGGTGRGGGETATSGEAAGPTASDDGAEGDTDDAGTDPTQTNGDETAAGGYGDDGYGDDGYGDDEDSNYNSDDDATDGGVDGPGRQFTLQLTDPLQRTAATANAEVELDRGTGQVCFRFEPTGLAAPYDTHIHVGPAAVKGGIVVDMGAQAGVAEGCTAVAPQDIDAILADLPGHYVELHDANGRDTIRAQMSDAMSDSGADGPEEVAGEFDPDSDGAVIVIEPGALIFRGEIPDQVTSDKLYETFADLDLGDTRVVDELQVVPGAPRPSGRILVDGGILFAVDSDVVTDPEGTVIADLATIFTARPSWSLAIVGHTDATGPDVYNLELSLRRAQAIRDALVAAGVGEEVLTVRGAGATDPAGDNSTPEGRAANRRIEFEITPA